MPQGRLPGSILFADRIAQFGVGRIGSFCGVVQENCHPAMGVDCISIAERIGRHYTFISRILAGKWPNEKACSVCVGSLDHIGAIGVHGGALRGVRRLADAEVNNTSGI